MIGIAIINYKTYGKTIDCIESIRKTVKTPYKIYLLDNGSGNESAQILTEHYASAEDVMCIISSENHGYARGNNICIKYMREDGCKYGIISNNDIICDEYSVDTLIGDLKDNHDYLLVGPKIVDPQGNFQKSVKIRPYGKLEYLFKSTYLANFVRKEIKRENEQISVLNKFVDSSWVSGAFFAFDLDKMERAGDFDPSTFLFFEEYILSCRAIKCGYKLGYDPRVKVYHYHGASTGGGVNIISKIAADKSERYYLKKYLNCGSMFLTIVKMIRMCEVLFTFGKKRDWRSIKKYYAEVKRPLGE